MNKRLGVEGLLSVAELERRYRQAREGVARSQWQIIWLVAGGRTCQEAAAQTGYSVPWVREVIHRYNRQGPSGLGDRRQSNPGPKTLLSQEQQATLSQALDGPGPAGGRWSGPQVARWMSERLGRTVWAQQGWVYLRRLGFTPHRPRPRHVKADAAAQETFKGGRSKQP
jgi:transposase